ASTLKKLIQLALPSSFEEALGLTQLILAYSLMRESFPHFFGCSSHLEKQIWAVKSKKRLEEIT
ncbi:unnamed protein product, partial [Dovyalis caffra]